MRLLIVSDAWLPQGNGVVRTYLDLIPYLEADGHTVRVIGPGDFPWQVPMPGYAEIRLTPFPGRRLRRIFDAFQPESIHIATEGPLGWAARRLCLKRGWPFTTCYHTHFPDYAALRAQRHLGSWAGTPVRNAAIRMICRFHNRSAAVMTATPSLERTLIAWGVTAPLRRFTRGVDMAVFHPGPKALFSALARPVALFVGRVAIEKNIPAFLDMPWPGSKVVVGDGPDFEKLKQAYPQAVFTGVQKGRALAEHYRSADIFVFPSRTDTFGLVLIEAMACGLPVAGYRVTGPADIASDPTLGTVEDDLGRAAAGALLSEGTPGSRFSHLQRHYNWPTARDQFLEAQAAALIE